jgi:hypothetical protein
MRLIAMLAVLLATPALAYRPFDGTDADVAHAGELELELGPVGRLREGEKKFRIAPALVANIGFAEGFELVLEGQREVALNPERGERRSVLEDNGAFIKQVVRRGALQDESGPSVAMEYGLLLPPIPDGGGTGISLAGIVSQRWDVGTMHLNAALARTREHEPDVFLAAIAEGPITWTVRPVAEAFTERATGSARIYSGLVGAIWRVGDGLSFDVGLRHARAGAGTIDELRVGLTWAFSFRKEP